MSKHFAIALPSCEDIRSEGVPPSLCHLVAMSITYTSSARKQIAGIMGHEAELVSTSSIALTMNRAL
jgi:hypothetical protein